MARERILVVDDEPHIVLLCQRILAEADYEVAGAHGGLEGMAHLAAEPCDLLLVDIKMPDMDGLSLLRWAKERDPDLAALVFTGYATMDKAIEAMRAGARRFVHKPFTPEDLIKTVEDVLDERRREQERLRLHAQLPILEMSQAMVTEGDPVSLARGLLELAVRQLGATSGFLALWQADPEGLTPVAMQPAGGLASELFAALDPACLPELFADGQPRLLSGAEAQAVFVPLSMGQKHVGVLGLGPLATRGTYRSSDLNLLSIVGRQIAIALENVRMVALEQQRTTELARALEQRKELDRLKDEFMHNVSHELRTPLAMILGYAELLVDGVLGSVRPEQGGPLQIIVERARVLTTLVDNITALLANQGREPEHEPVSFVQLVSAALSDFQVLAQRANLTLRGAIEPQVPEVMGDLDHLRKVVDNLMGNAIKFTPAGGRVDVCLGCQDGEVVLQVADTGVGIPEAQIDRIFERFYQVDGSIRRVYGGSGLGLALVHEIVARHSGRVDVQSRLGQGSTFTVRLPAYTPQEAG